MLIEARKLGRAARLARETAQRELLLQAMARAAAEKGYEWCRVEDVIEWASLSRSTFYKHFRNKEECFLAAFDAAVEAMVERVEAAAEGRAAFGARVHAGTGALIELLVAEPALARLTLIEIRAAGEAGLERFERLLDRFACLLDDAGQGGERASSPGELSRLIVGGLATAISQEVAAGRAAQLAGLELLFPPLVPPSELKRRSDGAEDGGEGLEGTEARQISAPRQKIQVTAPRKSGDARQSKPKRARKPLPRARTEAEQRAGLCAAMVEGTARRGYAATTIHEVVSTSGFGKATYYKFFPTKEACFLVAFEACAEAIFKQVEDAVGDKTAPTTRARAGLETLLDLLGEEPQLMRVALIEARAAGMPSREAQVKWLKRLAELFADGKPGAEEAWSERMALGAVCTIIALEVAAGRATELPGMAGELVEAALAPCSGTTSAAG
jgi:AcrR family transcriptional regulator